MRADRRVETLFPGPEARRENVAPGLVAVSKICCFAALQMLRTPTLLICPLWAETASAGEWSASWRLRLLRLPGHQSNRGGQKYRKGVLSPQRPSLRRTWLAWGTETRPKSPGCGWPALRRGDLNKGVTNAHAYETRHTARSYDAGVRGAVDCRQ